MTTQRDRELLAREYGADFHDVEGSYLTHAALRAIAKAREDERGAVVRWIKRQVWREGPNWSSAFLAAASAIERGDHLSAEDRGVGADPALVPAGPEPKVSALSGNDPGERGGA